MGLGVRVRSARPAKAVVGVVGAAAFRRVGLRVRWALHGGLAVAGVVVAEGLIEVDDLLDAGLGLGVGFRSRSKPTQGQQPYPYPEPEP